MILTNDELKVLFCGALRFIETDDGYLWPKQHTVKQEEYFKNLGEFFEVRASASSSKTIEFHTSATEISIEYKMVWPGSLDTFELCIDGIICDVRHLEEMEPEGKIEFCLPDGNKRVSLYLPADATAVVRNLCVNAPVSPVKKSCKVLWMGDSITQGFGPYRSAETYVSIVSREFGLDVLNQGVGGYIYDKNLLMKMGDYMPDKIITAYGTNQYKSGDIQPVKEYYEKLSELYPGVPVLCITPLWRHCDDYEIFADFCEKIKDVCKIFPQITVVDGFGLVPHLREYLKDDVHPNLAGSILYGKNLVDEIKRLKFI